jgi:hypothetical protein
VNNDYHGSIVKATLDAVNRFITKQWIMPANCIF